ncbi:ketopantoate reductase family protein, partial [Burkholderia cepacia]|nr:2-dehydropantoate 2-reductase [Burkholderia cepacia]
MNDTNSGSVRAAVVGVGAIGGLLAAALSRAGMTVSAYARGATLDALNAHGVRVIDEAGTTSSVPVRASDDAAALGVQDYVVIALKAQALPALAARIAPLVGPDTVIVAA